MATLSSMFAGSPQYVTTANPGLGNAGMPNAPDNVRAASNAIVVDGTPVRVAVLALSAAAGLTALKWAGFRFNVAVSN